MAERDVALCFLFIHAAARHDCTAAFCYSDFVKAFAHAAVVTIDVI